MPEKLGEFIRRIRKEKNLGLRATAREVGITAGYLSRIETGAEPYPPGEEVIRKLAVALGLDFDELMRIAGRVANVVMDQVREDPQMPEFLRQVRERGITAERLIEMLKREEKG
jgi:transcriptional regulator with XRE-family HTH domain